MATDEVELLKLVKLINDADLITLTFGERKIGLGKDLQKALVSALQTALMMRSSSASYNPEAQE